MPPLVLHILPDPVGLLHEAADGAHGFRMDGILLALRQGGIRDDLFRMAGEAGCPGWFDPPVCTFHELPDRLGGSPRMPLSDDERAVLLEQLFATHGGSVFSNLLRPAEFVDPVDTLFGELVAEGGTPDQFDAAAGLARVHEPWDAERNRALAAIYRGWHKALAAATPARRDGRDTLLDVAEAIRADPAGLGERLRDRRELRIMGLTDLRGGWRALLAALRTSPAFERVTIFALDDHLLSEGLKPDTIEGPGMARPLRPVTILHAPDTDREIEEVAVRVRRLLDAGVPPHRIAVVSRRARPHMDLALTALERAGVPATARRRIGYREIPVVKSLVFLIQAAAEGWTRHGLSELARQPYFASRLDVRIIDFLGYRRSVAGLGDWTAALDGLVDEAVAREAAEESEDERRGWLPPSDRVSETRRRFDAFTTVARELDVAKPLVEWNRWLERFLADDPWEMERRIRKVPDGRWDVARVDLAGWKALHETMRGWRVALETWGTDGTPLTAEQFLARLGAVLSGDATLWTTCRRGVQVLEGLNAAYRGFEHLFVVGLEAGTFPVRRPRSAVLHEEDRGILRDAGLPLDLEGIWETRERALFAALEAGGTSLTLSHATLDASGRDVVGSIFLEEVRAAGATEETIPTSRVITPGLPLVADTGAASAALTAARMEAARATGRLSPWNGLIEDPVVLKAVSERFGESYLWSPTQLESYAKCPWSWFSGRVLRMEKLEDPDQEIDAAVRGTVWHSALERFWARATALMDGEGRKGEQRLLRNEDLRWALPLLAESLAQAWDAHSEGAWLGHPSLHTVTKEAMQATLAEYIRWEAQFNEDSFDKRKRNAPKTLRTAVHSHELKIQAVLDRAGVRFTYRGTIDRVDVGVDARVVSGEFVAAIDYKSSVWSTPGGGDSSAWDDGVVLQVPLYAHALTQLMPGARVSRTEYRTIRKPQSAHTLQLVAIENPNKAPRLAEDVEAKARMEGALDAAAEHVAAVRAGRYPAKPADSCMCPPFCHAWDVCRVKGGPKGKW